jgi:hypothetical protein
MVASSSSSGAARGGEELHDAEHVPRAPDRKRERGAQAGPRGNLGSRQGPGMLVGIGDPRRDARLPHLAGQALAACQRQRAARLGERLGGREGALPGPLAAQARASRVARFPERAEVPCQHGADGRQQPRVRVVLVGARGQDARHRVLRAQDHGGV